MPAAARSAQTFGRTQERTVVLVSQGLFAVSAAIVLVLGTLHLAFTFRGKRFDPRDAELLARMKEVSPFITRQTTIWRAGQGFHASHSFGAMLFGLVYLYLALEPTHFLLGSRFLLSLGLVYLLAMVVLARRYWFSIPFHGVSLSCIAYAGALVASAA
jgi:hypothetical protein